MFQEAMFRSGFITFASLAISLCYGQPEISLSAPAPRVGQACKAFADTLQLCVKSYTQMQQTSVRDFHILHNKVTNLTKKQYEQELKINRLTTQLNRSRDEKKALEKENGELQREKKELEAKMDSFYCVPPEEALLGSIARPAASCAEIANDRGESAQSGEYYIISNGYRAKVYCHMTSLGSCGGDAWTTLMKIDGRKPTFLYESPLWLNRESYNVNGGTTGFDFQETKLPTFSGMPFKELCLVFRSYSTGNYSHIHIPISGGATSLHSVMSSPYTSTAVGRDGWLSSVSHAQLQPHCNKEGFNVRSSNKIRIGLLANNENDCASPDTFIGVGLARNFGSCCYPRFNPKVSAGFFFVSGCCARNEVVSGQAFVYILAQ